MFINDEKQGDDSLAFFSKEFSNE